MGVQKGIFKVDVGKLSVYECMLREFRLDIEIKKPGLILSDINTQITRMPISKRSVIRKQENINDENQRRFGIVMTPHQVQNDFEKKSE